MLNEKERKKEVKEGKEGEKEIKISYHSYGFVERGS